MVRRLQAAGHTVSIGLGQVNDQHLARRGISVESLFDPLREPARWGGDPAGVLHPSSAGVRAGLHGVAGGDQCVHFRGAGSEGLRRGMWGW